MTIDHEFQIIVDGILDRSTETTTAMHFLSSIDNDFPLPKREVSTVEQAAQPRWPISRVAEHFQGPFDTIILHQQLHAPRSAFHTDADTDDDGGYPGSIQRDSRHICFDS